MKWKPKIPLHLITLFIINGINGKRYEKKVVDHNLFSGMNVLPSPLFVV